MKQLTRIYALLFKPLSPITREPRRPVQPACREEAPPQEVSVSLSISIGVYQLVRLGEGLIRWYERRRMRDRSGPATMQA